MEINVQHPNWKEEKYISSQFVEVLVQSQLALGQGGMAEGQHSMAAEDSKTNKSKKAEMWEERFLSLVLYVSTHFRIDVVLTPIIPSQ